MLLEKGYLEHPGSACCTDDTFEILLRILKRTDFWNVYKWLAGAYRGESLHCARTARYF